MVYGICMQKMPGIGKVAVDLASKTARVEIKAESSADTSKLIPSLIQAVSDLGFEAKSVS